MAARLSNIEERALSRKSKGDMIIWGEPPETIDLDGHRSLARGRATEFVHHVDQIHDLYM